MFRRVGLLALAALTLLCAAACGKPEVETAGTPSEATGTEAGSPEIFDERMAPYDASEYLVAMLYAGRNDALHNAALHGFLRTAENLGYPAKVYTEGTPLAMMEQALQAGCKGVAVWAQDVDVKDALQKAKAAGVPTVAVYGRVDEGLSSSNLHTDSYENALEAAKLITLELEKRKHTSGSIVLSTDMRADKNEVEAMRSALRQVAGAYTLLDYHALTLNADTMLSEAVQYFKDHLNIVAVVCYSDTLSTLWTNARKKTEADIKPTPTPKTASKATPTPTPKPSGTGTPTDAAAPITKLDTVIVGMDYTKENIALTKSGALYGFIARPYYDGGAQGCMLLDQLLRGALVPEQYELYAPLVRKDGSAKYESISNEVGEWFGN